MMDDPREILPQCILEVSFTLSYVYIVLLDIHCRRSVDDTQVMMVGIETICLP